MDAAQLSALSWGCLLWKLHSGEELRARALEVWWTSAKDFGKLWDWEEINSDSQQTVGLLIPSKSYRIGMTMNDPLVSSRGCCDPVTWLWQIHSALRFEMFVSINGTTWDAWPHQLHGWNRLSLWLKEEPTTRHAGYFEWLPTIFPPKSCPGAWKLKRLHFQSQGFGFRIARLILKSGLRSMGLFKMARCALPSLGWWWFWCSMMPGLRIY